MTSTLELGRQAFALQAWGEAYALLASCEGEEAEDVECLAVAAHLVGRDDESAAAWERAHLAYMGRGDSDGAARCAFWLSLLLLLRGESARAGGWFARVERAVGSAGQASAVRRFLLVPVVLDALGRGDIKEAAELADEIVAVAHSVGDSDLLALGVLGRGQAALALGETKHGMKLLDEAMVSVTAGEVSPIPAGIVYCAVIEACMDAFDLRRAAEWTEALERWCAAQPGLVPYRGQCLVHRSQVLQAHGEWSDAAAAAERARAHLSDAGHPALGLALYEQGELLRLQGDFGAAERAYRAAGEQGREPAPGFALLRLAEGKVGPAVAAIKRMVEESRGQLSSPAMLAAAVDVLVAAAEVDAARAACDELVVAAAAVDQPLLHAIAAYATGSVLLAEGEPLAALAALRDAGTRWRALDMPYDAARARVQIARACRLLDDDDAADRELDAAQATFERLGARPDILRLAALRDSRASSRLSVLTDREREVLRLVATGKANRDIASDLFISEHTVARHVQNIFMKLSISSRAAATAYAYEHGLV